MQSGRARYTGVPALNRVGVRFRFPRTDGAPAAAAPFLEFIPDHPHAVPGSKTQNSRNWSLVMFELTTIRRSNQWSEPDDPIESTIEISFHADKEFWSELVIAADLLESHRFESAELLRALSSTT